MNCRAFELIVLALARNAEAHAQGLAHVETCMRCAARLAEERALLRGVRAVNTDLAHETAPARVEATLLAAFHTQAAPRKEFVLKPLAVRQQRMSWGWGIAWATALLVIFSMAWMWSLGLLWLKPQPDAPKLAARQTPPTQPAPSLPTIAVNNEVKVPFSKSLLARRIKPRRAQPIASEAATPFYPLIGASELVSLESGRVVRVEVPAATLIPYGVPLTAEAMSQPVQADLLIGQDGLARAIRFLPAGYSTKTQ